MVIKTINKSMSFYKNPLVSVIIPTYNHKQFVGEAVESVLNQSFKNIEVIIVDDGSSDGTAGKLNNFKDSRINLLKLSENRKVHPRNLALSFARGKYIAFQNSDDIWLKDKLHYQLQCFSNNNELSAVFTKVEMITKNGNKYMAGWANNIFTNTNKSAKKWLRTFFDDGNCLCISSALVKRKCFDKIGWFDESLVQLSDLDLWIRLASVGGFYIINKPLTKMRILGNKNASSPNKQNSRRSAIEFAQVLDRFTTQKSLIKLDEVFADIIEKDMPKLIQKAKLATYAWNKTPSHRLYADKLFSSLLSNTNQRLELTEYFGVEVINEFIKKRAELEIVVHG